MQPLIIAVIAFLAGCQITSWKYEADINEDARNRAEAEAEVLRKNRAEQQSLQDEIGSLTDELQRKNKELEVERDSVNDGSSVVLVAATCPDLSAERSALDTARRGFENTARLNEAARQDYLDFKREYAQQLDDHKKCVAFARRSLGLD